MRMLRIAPFIMTILLCVVNVVAQRDTTTPDMTVYGTLVRATATQIDIQELLADGTTRIQEISIVDETQIGGCSLDSVQVGVQALAVLSPLRIYPPRAELVKFDGCTPHIDVQGVVTSVTMSELELVTSQASAFGSQGTTVSFDLSSATQVISCDGYQLVVGDVRVGEPVYVRSNGEIADPSAVTVQVLNDCSQVTSAEVSFIAVVDSTMLFLVDNTADTLTLKIDPNLISTLVPGDSAFPLYACDGSMIALDDLKAGTSMSVTYLVSPRRGLYFQYGMVKDNCPIPLQGVITAIKSPVITITAAGVSTDVTVASSTQLHDCQRQQITFTDLAVGQAITGHAIDEGSTLVAQKLFILDDCPFAFSVGGVITAISSASVMIDAADPITGDVGVDVSFDARTQVVDCTQLPVDRSSLAVGSTVSVYYRISKGACIADLVMVYDPCVDNTFRGTIQDVTPQVVGVLLDNGDVAKYFFDDSSAIVNCRGEAFRLTSSAAGSRIEGFSTSTGSGGFILSATVYTDCIDVVRVTGTITMVNDSIVAVRTVDGVREALKGPQTLIASEAGTLLDWSELLVGRQVCMAVDATTQLVLRAIVDVTGDGSVRTDGDPTMIIGVLESASGGELTLSTASGTIVFALTPATQMMDEQRNTLGASSMTPGSGVRVMSKGHTTSLTPIAATVVLLSSSSVDEAESSVDDLVVFPNPATSTVSFRSEVPFESIVITTVLGDRVAELRSSASLDVSALAPGAYVVSARRGTEQVVRLLHVKH